MCLQHLGKYVPTFVSCITHTALESNTKAFCAHTMHKGKQGKPGKDSHSVAEFSVSRTWMGWAWLVRGAHTCAHTDAQMLVQRPTKVSSSCAWEGPGEQGLDGVWSKCRVSSAYQVFTAPILPMGRGRTTCLMLDLPHTCSICAGLWRHWPLGFLERKQLLQLPLEIPLHHRGQNSRPAGLLKPRGSCPCEFECGRAIRVPQHTWCPSH